MNNLIETDPIATEYIKKKILALNSDPHPTGISKKFKL